MKKETITKETITIDDLKNHLPEFQRNLDCHGAVRLLKEFVLSDGLSQKLSVKTQSKLLFFYLGIDNADHNVHHYLIWLENEGAMLVDMSMDPNSSILMDGEPILIDDGTIGYGKIIIVPVRMELTWENNRPQVKNLKTAELIELADVPKERPMESRYKFFDDAKFYLQYLLFGNPNLFLYLSEDSERCLSFMGTEGKNLQCMHDTFNIDMFDKGPALRKLIIETGDSDPKIIERIVSQFQKNNK